MNKAVLKTLIAVILALFVFMKILADQFCAPTPNNAVVQAVTNAVTGPSSAQSTVSNPPDPLSWEPTLRRVLSFFSKACAH